MTPTEMRDIIDNLVQQYGFEKVKNTIESILSFYERKERKDG